jgi:NTP pyrophosphatase (non-canonical NTP hydrolase)
VSVSLKTVQEAVSAASHRYTQTFGIQRSGDWVALKLCEEAGEVVQSYIRATGRSRHGLIDTEQGRQAIADELADLIGMIFILATEAGLDADRDLIPAIEKKWHTSLRQTE